MNLTTILAGLLLLASVGNAFQWYTNDVLTVKLASAEKSRDSAAKNEKLNGDSAAAWQVTGVNLAAKLNACYDEKQSNTLQNEAALSVANKTAADTAARLAVWQQQFAKLAKSGPVAQLMSTKLPDEVLP